MDWRSLPPLQALKAFSAYAETGSVQKAGAALNVTHAAISQQIRNLETYLGVTLLDRSGRQAKLTDNGARFADALSRSFQSIISATSEIIDKEDSRALVVATTPSVVAHWLMPRLPEFRMLHPEIDVVFNADSKLVDLTAGEADIAIRFGKGTWDGLQSKLLLPTRMIAVAAPSLVPEACVTCLEDLAQFPVLQEIGTSENTLWLERRGVIGAGSGGLLALPGNLTLEAARAGQGIAVTASVWVQADLEAGRLVLLYEDTEQFGYFSVTPPGEKRRALAAFEKWLSKYAP